MSLGHYKLVDRVPVPCTLAEWGRMMEDGNGRRVAEFELGDVRVSTVFLGIDHQFGNGPPLLFETMIFGGEHDNYQDRCSTWKQAEAMHAKAVALAKAAS